MDYFTGVEALMRDLRDIQDRARPTGRIASQTRKDMRDIVVRDHRDKMLGGRDRYGRPRAPLAPATLADPRRGPGPSLVPRGAASRYVTNFEADWQTIGGADGLVIGLRDVPFARYHEEGVPSRHLPARPVLGITPDGDRKLDERHKRFCEQILRGH